MSSHVVRAAGYPVETPYILCKHCKGKISAKTQVCRHCGNKVGETNITTVLIIAMGMLLFLLIIGHAMVS
jgi:hypothetical protein